jgi:hypothetical protein
MPEIEFPIPDNAIVVENGVVVASSYRCTVRDKRCTMNDEEFWDDVFGMPDPFAEEVALDECFGIDTPNPCPECGASVACGYDSEGRPMMHIVERDE